MGTLSRGHRRTFDKGVSTVESDGAESVDFELADGSNAGVKEAEHNLDPGRLGGNGAQRVRRGMHEVVEEATGRFHLDTRGSRVIVANAINRLGDEGVKGLIVGHKFAGLAFARINRRADDRFGVENRTSLEGGDCRGKFRDSKGLARKEGLTEDMRRDGKEGTGFLGGKEWAIEGEGRRTRVR